MSKPRGRTAIFRISASLLSPLGRRIEARRRRRVFSREGIEGVAMTLRTCAGGHAAILRQFGAKVGPGCSFGGPIHIVKAERDFANLRIGDQVRFGADVVIDLSKPIAVEDRATLSPRATLLTAADPRTERPAGPIRIGAGAFVGPAATITPGVTVGEGAMVEATAVVAQDVAPGAAAAATQAMEMVNRR